MDFNTYQQETLKTAIYPLVEGVPWIYPALGLSGETGEIMEKLKKVIRDEKSVISNDKREEIKKELGDVLWYTAQLASQLGIDLNEVAEKNIQKLLDRQSRGKLKGNGDNR